MSSGRAPDYIIKVLNKVDEQRDILGAGWKRPEDGSIYLRFNRHVVVPVGTDFAISLFENEERAYVEPENRDEDGHKKRIGRPDRKPRRRN